MFFHPVLSTVYSDSITGESSKRASEDIRPVHQYRPNEYNWSRFEFTINETGYTRFNLTGSQDQKLLAKGDKLYYVDSYYGTSQYYLILIQPVIGKLISFSIDAVKDSFDISIPNQ